MRIQGLPFAALLIGAASLSPAAEPGLVNPLTPAQAQQARRLLAEFKAAPKGPYSQIRWYCKDGSVHPPAGLPCKERGGGSQYAELSAGAKTLAGWNLDVGTILASLKYEQFVDTERDHHRVREIILEKFLVDTDQGWVLRKAVSYRGARQAEDEEKSGRAFLQQLLEDGLWVEKHYLLANEAVAAVPHGVNDSASRKIRSLAQSVAEKDSRFQPLRYRIHSVPGPQDLPDVEKFLAEKSPSPAVKTDLDMLVGLLRERRDSGALEKRLPVFEQRLASTRLVPLIGKLRVDLGSRNAAESYRSGAMLSFAIRKEIATGGGTGRRLDMLDLNRLLQEAALVSGNGARQAATRRDRVLELTEDWQYAAGAGLISFRQFEALRDEALVLAAKSEVDSAEYLSRVRYLLRSVEWCRASVALDFGPVSRHFQDAERLAGGLPDHLLRGSVALPLSGRLDALATDTNRAAGLRHTILGKEVLAGVASMNPGNVRGKLGILEAGDEEKPVDPKMIYVIPETLSDLKPMAGILTLDSGNALSHAQLLAANLGIPNAVIPSSLLPLLRDFKGRELQFQVTSRGEVLLRDVAGLSDAERAKGPAKTGGLLDLDISRLALNDTRLIPLGEIGVADSGVRAGPKAANLGQLARFFPKNVAPGLVVPFGVYNAHIHRVLDGSGVPLNQQIAAAFAEAEKMRAAGAEDAKIRQYIYPKLASFRRQIEEMQLIPEFEGRLRAGLEKSFGRDGSFGVFVRSDTNSEDLPEFTGAGLNLTVPNVVGTDKVIGALKQVWASPFTERAFDWRSRILRTHDRVFPSVLLLRTVPSDKSGVLVTVNVETGNREESTVNLSEGVSAVVDGGVAESLLLRPDGTARLLQQARNPYRKVALPTGGFANKPGLRPDPLLSADEIRQIREMVGEVKQRYPQVKAAAGQSLPWDIELGFEKGELRLFQIRPLVRMQVPEAATAAMAARKVRLDAPLGN